MFDVIVVGAGLFGCAAARHLANKGAKVAVIGPQAPQNTKLHEGVFSSHYDQSRIVRRMTRDLPWAILTDRSIAQFDYIEQSTGIKFFYPRKGLHIAPSDKASVFIDAIEAIEAKMDVPIDILSSGEAIRQFLPLLGVPDNCQGYVEHEPAGHFNPLLLVDAQLQLIGAQGGEHIKAIVTGVTSKNGCIEVSTNDNKTYQARQVLVTTGAYTNTANILPKPLDIRVKAESLILVEISQDEFERLGDFPTLSYEYETDRINTLYMPPPLRHPDGKYYIKIGCNTASDRYLTSKEQISAWMKNGKNDDYNDDMVAALKLLIPNLDILSVTSKRCIITYTHNSRPIIDRVADNIFVATGGNGLGAKASDGIGAVAADLMINNRWVDVELNPQDFAARFATANQQFDQAFSSYGMARND